MLLVIESRADLAPVPADTAPRSTAQALRAMDWPFPVEPSAPSPRRLPTLAMPPIARADVVPLSFAPAPDVHRIAPRRTAPLPYGLALAEAR